MTQITAHSSTTIPPPHLSEYAKLRWSVKNPPLDPTHSFSGQTVLVTGANAGLGYAAALKYARKGCAKLILAVRSMAKGELAKSEILRASKRSARERGAEQDWISVVEVHLGDFGSVGTFIQDLKKEVGETGLHIALLNAGLANPVFEKSAAGYEMGLQVNLLSTALMAVGVVPLLQKTAEKEGRDTHLSFVNSAGHVDVKREWYAFGSESSTADEKEDGSGSGRGSLLKFANEEKVFDPKKSYGVLKLLGMAVMLHLAAVEPASSPTDPKVIINACCPFLCRNSLGRNFALPLRVVMGAMQYFTARSAEEGSRTLVSSTLLGRESHGLFWTHDVLHPLGEFAMDGEEMGRCWDEIKGELERNGVLGSLDEESRRWI